MLGKYLTAGLAASLLASTAFAQNAPTTDRNDMAPAATTVPAATTMAPATASEASFQGDWRASKLVGLNVYNNDNESIGSISELLTDKSGNIKAAVISVGGFLGVGSHLVAVPYDKIKFVNEPVAYTGVAGAPNAATSRPMSTTTTGAASNSTGPASTASSQPNPQPNPWYPDHALYNATKDELKAMPEFKYSN